MTDTLDKMDEEAWAILERIVDNEVSNKEAYTIVKQSFQAAYDEGVKAGLEMALSITQDTVWTTTNDSQNTFYRYQEAIRALKRKKEGE